jgi:hypothetical protein
MSWLCKRKTSETTASVSHVQEIGRGVKILGLHVDFHQGSRLAAKRRAQCAKACAQACARYRDRRKSMARVTSSKVEHSMREQEVLQEAGKEQANDSPTTQRVGGSLAQTDGDRPAPDVKLSVENSNASASSTITLTASTTFSCTVPCSGSSVIEADEGEVKVGHDPIEAVEERVVMEDVKKKVLNQHHQRLSNPPFR